MKKIVHYIIILCIGSTILLGKASNKVGIQSAAQEIDSEVSRALDKVLHKIKSNRSQFNAALRDSNQIDQVMNKIEQDFHICCTFQPDLLNKQQQDYYKFIQQRVGFWITQLNIKFPISYGLNLTESPLSVVGETGNSRPFVKILINFEDYLGQDEIDFVILHEFQHVLNRDILYTSIVFNTAKKHNIDYYQLIESKEYNHLRRLCEKRADIKAALTNHDVCNQAMQVFSRYQANPTFINNVADTHPTFLERFSYIKKINNLHMKNKKTSLKIH